MHGSVGEERDLDMTFGAIYDGREVEPEEISDIIFERFCKVFGLKEVKRKDEEKKNSIVKCTAE